MTLIVQEWWVIVLANLWITFVLHLFLALGLIKFILRTTQARTQQNGASNYPNNTEALLSSYSPSQSSYPPKATVVLCLRGADPFLADCLQGLLNQDYQHYNIQIVIDSEYDPAWQVVNQVIQDSQTNVEIRSSLLTKRYDTCGLKCSALIQAVSQLDANCEIIALADADMIASPTWLRNLIEPLLDPQVGLTTGNRWYAPSGNCLGSIVRYLWNALAVAIMYVFRLPWGGTLALRVNTVHQLGVLKYWQQSLVDDTSLHRLMHENNLEIRFIPALVMINREECLLPNFMLWATRQTLYSRLYSPFWGIILLITIYSTSSLFAAEVGSGYALLTAQTLPVLWLTTSLGLYFGSMLLILVAEDRLIWQMNPVKVKNSSFLTITNILKSLLLLPFMSYVFLATVLTAQVSRKIKWRGIEYQITGREQIQVLGYQPYCPTNSMNSNNSAGSTHQSEHSVSSLN